MGQLAVKRGYFAKLKPFGNNNPSVVWNRGVAVLQGLLYKVSLYAFNRPELLAVISWVVALKGWPLSGVPL